MADVHLETMNPKTPMVFSSNKTPSIFHGEVLFFLAKIILVLKKQFLKEEVFNLDAFVEQILLKSMLEASSRLIQLRTSCIHLLHSTVMRREYNSLY